MSSYRSWLRQQPHSHYAPTAAAMLHADCPRAKLTISVADERNYAHFVVVKRLDHHGLHHVLLDIPCEDGSATTPQPPPFQLIPTRRTVSPPQTVVKDDSMPSTYRPACTLRV
eukprot:1778719-Amphidinium_carterae.1